MTSWNNPKAAALDEERRKLIHQLMQKVLSQIVNRATKQSIEMRNDPDAKPTKEIIIAKIMQDFTLQVFPNITNLSTTIDALILDFPTDVFLSSDPSEKMSVKTLTADTRKYMHEKVGREETKRLRSNRVVEVVAMLVAYLFTTQTILFDEDLKPEEQDETAFNVFYLFNETVVGFLGVIANTKDIASVITRYVKDDVKDLKTPTSDFIDRIRANTKLYEGILEKAKRFTNEFEASRAKRKFDAPGNNGRGPTED
jgi:transcriptional regulator of met regulon